jgi:hypothetical protein
MKKKADVNWVVVSMVLAVIVLAITAYLFWKYSTTSANQSAGIASCEGRGGDCLPVSTPCPEGKISFGKFSCAENQHCCVPAGSSS